MSIGGIIGPHYYHQLLRKYTVLFGTLFNNITVKTYNSAFTQELERVKVPVVYGPRELWMARINSDPNLDRATQITLPRISFSLAGIERDPERAQHKLLKMPKANTSSHADTSFIGVPYRLTFSLNIYARNTHDANQIVEQILPAFTPQYTISGDFVPDLGFIKDIKVTLESVDENIDYEGDFQSVRTINWTMQFSMDVYFFGYVTQTKLIRRVFANTFIDPALQAGAIVRVNLTNGNNGDFKLEDVAYQGNSVAESTAAGIVVKWDANNSYLRIAGAQGTFKQNVEIKGASTNAVYTLNTFDATPLKVVSIKVDPDPITANADDPYGYTITQTEYPDTVD